MVDAVIDKEHEELINHCYLQRCVNTVFGQMSATKGIKKFDERRLATKVKEFTQLNEGAAPSQNKPVMVPIDISTFTKKEKRKAMNAVNLIKEKRDGRIKRRTCGDGSKHQLFLKYGDTTAS